MVTALTASQSSKATHLMREADFIEQSQYPSPANILFAIELSNLSPKVVLGCSLALSNRLHCRHQWSKLILGQWHSETMVLEHGTRFSGKTKIMKCLVDLIYTRLSVRLSILLTFHRLSSVGCCCIYITIIIVIVIIIIVVIGFFCRAMKTTTIAFVRPTAQRYQKQYFATKNFYLEVFESCCAFLLQSVTFRWQSASLHLILYLVLLALTFFFFFAF